MYVLVSSKSSKQSSKSTQDQITALNKKIADLQKQISGLNQNPQTVYVNNSTSNGDSGTKDGSDSYDKNKDYWAGKSQNMYVDGPVMLYTDGNSGSYSVDRVFGMTDNIHTIETWVNNSVEGLYPVEYNGQKLFVDSGDVTNLDADNSSNQLYFKDGSYFANYSPEKSNVRTFDDLHWNEYTPTGVYYWVFRDGSWHDDSNGNISVPYVDSNGTVVGSNDSNPAPTANQKKIEDLRDQIQAMNKQITTINQNMDQINTSINKIYPYENSDIPTSDKLDGYNNGASLDSLDKDLSYWNSLATDANKKLNQLSPNDNEYYVVNSKIKRYNDMIKEDNEEISHYNSMTKAITDAGGQAGYLKKAKYYSDQYNSLDSKLGDLTKQKNGLEDKINSLSAQIDTLENQQD